MKKWKKKKRVRFCQKRNVYSENGVGFFILFFFFLVICHCDVNISFVNARFLSTALPSFKLDAVCLCNQDLSWRYQCPNSKQGLTEGKLQ